MISGFCLITFVCLLSDKRCLYLFRNDHVRCLILRQVNKAFSEFPYCLPLL